MLEKFFKKWGCIGIRQDDLVEICRNQVIVLSHLRSVSTFISAKPLNELAARVRATQFGAFPKMQFNAVPVMA